MRSHYSHPTKHACVVLSCDVPVEARKVTRSGQIVIYAGGTSIVGSGLRRASELMFDKVEQFQPLLRTASGFEGWRSAEPHCVAWVGSRLAKCGKI